MKTPSIVHLGKFYPPHHGGIETHVRDLAVRHARVWQVSVIASNTRFQNQTEMVENVRVIRVARMGTIASMPICPGLPAALHNCPADLVHLHTPNPGAARAFLVSRHSGKLVVTHHADTIGRKTLRRLADPYVRRAMERASAIVVTSRGYLRSSEELAPFTDKCVVIPLGIEIQELASGEHAIQLPHEVPAGPFVLAVGRLVPYKGFDVLIHAMKQVDAPLLLIGAGPQAAYLSALAEKEGVARKISTLGRVSDLRPYFRAASVFVLPSKTRAEAFGIVQLEAMAAGLPVINTNLDSGVPEVSVHEETGLTVEPGDAHALAGAIRLLLENSELRCRLGSAAAAKVMQDHTADVMAERTLALYREVLAKAE